MDGKQERYRISDGASCRTISVGVGPETGGVRIIGGSISSQLTRPRKEYAVVELFVLRIDSGIDGACEDILSSRLNVARVQSDGRTVSIDFVPYELADGSQLAVHYESIASDGGTGHGGTGLESTVTLSLDGRPTDRRLRHLFMDVLTAGSEDLVFTAPPTFDVSRYADGYTAEQMQLGEPVYFKGLIMGSRFPANKNDAVAFEQLGLAYVPDGFTADGVAARLDYRTAMPLEDCRDNPWTSWKSVAVASSATDMEGLRGDFWRYLEGIVVPPVLKLQYNCWFEAFLAIDRGRFLGACEQMARIGEKYGMPKLDTYVLDDGWNTYNDQEFTGIHEADSGTEANRSGFWEFNTKFPGGMPALGERMSSDGRNLGLWFGPQGGYVYEGTFSKFLRSRGNGEVNEDTPLGDVIDANEGRYLRKLKPWLLGMQREGRLAYWKLDGFATASCLAPDHQHYCEPDAYVTQQWERWIDIFEAMREQNPDIFINATSYVPCSPWMLQWVNSIWLQNCDDREQPGDAAGEAVDQAITGRDRIYARNTFEGGIQLPLTHYYNHEPIYGHAEETPYSDAGFARYLLVNAMRGTTIWELHLSADRLTDPQWRSLASVLRFVRDHFATLKTSRMFVCADGVGKFGDALLPNTISAKAMNAGYGFWCDNARTGESHERLVLVRNPSAITLEVALPSGVAGAEQLVVVYNSADQAVVGSFFEAGSKLVLPPSDCVLLANHHMELDL